MHCIALHGAHLIPYITVALGERAISICSHDGEKKMQSHSVCFFSVGFCDRLLNVRMWMYVARHLYCFYDVMEQQHQFQKIHSKSRMIKIFKENFFERPTGDFFSGFSIVLCQFLRRLYLLAVNKSSLTFRRCFKYTQKIWPSLFIPHKLRSNV